MTTYLQSQLKGRVCAADGIAIFDSMVTAYYNDDKSLFPWSAWTDEDGNFKFHALPEGRFRIEVSKFGFMPATQEIDLLSASKTVVEVFLQLIENQIHGHTSNAERGIGANRKDSQ
jgi:Carboxypeptidase regulatory-like domain